MPSPTDAGACAWAAAAPARVASPAAAVTAHARARLLSPFMHLSPSPVARGRQSIDSGPLSAAARGGLASGADLSPRYYGRQPTCVRPEEKVSSTNLCCMPRQKVQRFRSRSRDLLLDTRRGGEVVLL